MKTRLLWLVGCRNHRRSVPHGQHRSCSSQPWFAHPYAPRYWENDPNATPGFAATAPRPSSYAPTGINRGMPNFPPPAFAPQQAPPAAAFGAPRSGMHPLPPPNLPEARPWDAPQHKTPPRSPMDVKPQMLEASDAFSSLIEQFHKKGMLQEVDSVLRGMKVAQIILSLPAYRTLIDIYAQAGDLERMDLIYGEMRKATMKSAGHQLAEATPIQKQEASDFFAAMVDSCHRKGLLNEVQQIHKAMKAAQLPISIPTYNVLMDVYGQLKDCDKMDAAYMEMRETLAQRRFPPPPNASAHSWITSSAKESARSPPPPPPTLFNPAARPGDGFHHQLQTPPPPPGWFSANMQPSPQFHQQQQPPSTFGNLPFQPPPPGQHFQSGAGGPPPFQYLAPPGFPPGTVMNSSMHPPGQFQFQQQQAPPSTTAQVGAPLLQSFVAPAAGAVQQMVAPAPVEIQSAAAAASLDQASAASLDQASAAAEEEVEEDQEEEVEEQETSEHEDQEAEDGEETETGEEQQESTGDTGREEVAVETMVIAGDQPGDHPQLMESTG